MALQIIVLYLALRISISVPGNVIAAAVGDVNSSVKRERLQDVAQRRPFYKNNMLDGSHQPLSAEDIIERASSLIGTLWDFRLLSSNCEHFASEMRYGVAISLQAVEARMLIAERGALAVTATTALLGTLSRIR